MNRADFPTLQEQVHGHPLVYLDNAATTHKPYCVIDALAQFYRHDNANIHRGVHTLSVRATERYEAARKIIQSFINAPRHEEVIFVRGATEGINLVASSFGRAFVKAGDEILVTHMEHHSNIVPWQLLCDQVGATLKVVPINEQGELDQTAFAELLSAKTKLFAVAHMSNALGTINPIKQMIDVAHQANVPVLVDGAQAGAHLKVDVQDLDCDFYVLSGHKLFGPTGIGVLYGKSKWLDAMPPYQGGGDMIQRVTFEGSTFQGLPNKFEAGTPNIVGAIGLGAAVEYINALDMAEVQQHEADLLTYATQMLKDNVQDVRIVGEATEKSSVLSFILGNVHAHDIGTILDHSGIAIRAGHHCAMPVMKFFGVAATARASFALYNTREEVDALITGLQRVQEMFA